MQHFPVVSAVPLYQWWKIIVPLYSPAVSNVPLCPQYYSSFRCVRGDLSPFHYVRRFVISDLICVGYILTNTGYPFIFSTEVNKPVYMIIDINGRMPQSTFFEKL